MSFENGPNYFWVHIGEIGDPRFVFRPMTNTPKTLMHKHLPHYTSSLVWNVDSYRVGESLSFGGSDYTRRPPYIKLKCSGS